MFNMRLPTPTLPPLKRKSFEDPNEQPSKRPATMSSNDMQQHPPEHSRSFGSFGAGPVQFQPRPQTWQTTHSHTLPQTQPQQTQPVNIQPRPSPNGLLAVPSPILSSKLLPPRRLPRARPPTGRRRGRPSKADLEARLNATQPQSTAHTPISHAQAVAATSSTPFQQSLNFSQSERTGQTDSTTHRAPSNDSIPETSPLVAETSPRIKTRHGSDGTPSLSNAAPSTDARGEHTSENTYRYESSAWRESVLQPGRSPERSPAPMESQVPHDSPPARLQRSSYLPSLSGYHVDSTGSTGSGIEHGRRENYPSIIEPSTRP